MLNSEGTETTLNIKSKSINAGVLIERGEALIFPEQLQSWKQCVLNAIFDEIEVLCLQVALNIMEKMENGATKEEYSDLLIEQGLPGHINSNERNKVRSLILFYSKEGPAFYAQTTITKLSEYESLAVILQTFKNRRFCINNNKRTRKLNSQFDPNSPENVKELKKTLKFLS
ncbi:MAG: hypothetical protein PHQ89_00110 [Bacilli bacterium]|nr:hypothetical protein [Bacilli bacterium]